MPLLRAAMYAKDIQIYCAPTADDRETWMPTMRHIALEGRCFVLSACQYIRRGDYPADYPAIQGDDPQTVLMRGGSLIVNPLGRVLAEPDFSGEKILSADLDPGEIAEGKFDLDVTGHYSRPDVFRLEVNEKALHTAKSLREAGRSLYSRENDRSGPGTSPKRRQGFFGSVARRLETEDTAGVSTQEETR